MSEVHIKESTVDLGLINRDFEDAMMTIYYEIRIAGHVPPGALRGFEQLAAEQPTETLVRGPLPDQAALHGLLARLQSAGVQVIGLRRRMIRPAATSHRVTPHE